MLLLHNGRSNLSGEGEGGRGREGKEEGREGGRGGRKGGEKGRGRAGERV